MPPMPHTSAVLPGSRGITAALMTLLGAAFAAVTKSYRRPTGGYTPVNGVNRVVHAANIPDRQGGKQVLQATGGAPPRLQRIWADQGYNGALIPWTAQKHGMILNVVYPQKVFKKASPLAPCQADEEKPDADEIDEGLGGASEAFVVLAHLGSIGDACPSHEKVRSTTHRRGRT